MRSSIVKRLLTVWIIGVILVFLAHARCVYTGDGFFDQEYWRPHGIAVVRGGGYRSASYGQHVAEFWSDSLQVLPAYTVALILPIAFVFLVRWIIRGKKEG